MLRDKLITSNFKIRPKSLHDRLTEATIKLCLGTIQPKCDFKRRCGTVSIF